MREEVYERTIIYDLPGEEQNESLDKADKRDGHLHVYGDYKTREVFSDGRGVGCRYIKECLRCGYTQQI